MTEATRQVVTSEGGTKKTQEKLQGQSLFRGPGRDLDPDRGTSLHVAPTARRRDTREVSSEIRRSQTVLEGMRGLAHLLTQEGHLMPISDSRMNQTLSQTKTTLIKSRTQSSMTRRLTCKTNSPGTRMLKLSELLEI